MQDSNPLISQVEQEIKDLSSTSPTAAGQADSSKKSEPSESQIDTINQVFALFRINYHNQYFSAFADVETLNHAKRLWLDTLQRFQPEQILQGARSAIEQSEYLPTLHKMIGFCNGGLSRYGLPDAHHAYLEACRAPSPKNAYNWSHPAVYHAGNASDWYFIANNIEKIAFPIFKNNYEILCQRVVNGEELAAPIVPALPETIETPLSKEENIERMSSLREQFDL